MRNSQEMKAGNRLGVLRLIRRGPIARSEIARDMGLTRAAISLIAGALHSEGLIFESGRRESAVGRQPTLVDLNPDYAYSLGMTVSRTGAEVGVCDLKGRLLCRTPVDIAGASRSEALLRLKNAAKVLLQRYPPDNRHWLGLGISTPGPVDVLSGQILNPPNFDRWHGTQMCDEMRDIGLGQVFLENNSQALTMAEKAYGIGRQCQRFILLVVEAGIGGGIVLGEHLYSGWHGFGNEIGHTSINQNGPLCDCGLRGCVELYASVPKLLAIARKRYPRIASWRDFMDLASSGYRLCENLLEQQIRALGTAVVNALNILEPDAIVLTGDILYKGEALRSGIERFVAGSAINRRLRQVPVHLSPLGERPELMAAAEIVMEQFFQGKLEPEPVPVAPTPRLQQASVPI
jgi:predicted NBD/HSP70 family sugar kinase